MDTRLRMTPAELDRFEPSNARSFCDHCGREHRWVKSDVWLDGFEPLGEARRTG